MQIYLPMLIVSALLSLLLTWGVRDFAVWRGIFPPRDSHHIHERAVPRIGGIAIFAAFSSFVLLYVLVFLPSLPPSQFALDIAKVAIPGTALFAVGLVDDLIGLRARVKLLFQIVGGVALYFSGLSFPALDLNLAGLPVGAILSFCLTIFWVVLLCNGLNFIDGLDGLAAGNALLASMPLFVLALITGRPVLSMWIVILSGTLLGFLVFNFNPATIFLGDSGSLFIGFILSGLLLSESRTGTHNLRLTCSLLVAFVLPITDTGLSVLRRLLNRKALFSPDRQHIHHRLLSIGFPHLQAVLILYGVSAVASCLSIFLFIAPPIAAAGAFALGVLLASQVFKKIRHIEDTLTLRRLRMSLHTIASSTLRRGSEDQAIPVGDLDADPAFSYYEEQITK
jgi:UDP-GlcNAc:undecaprenyl-phosphate/decaprenyl-phosphate GlcNAc-1-phosphate transferase